jgi:nucleoside-diphosphate-sugar epimerase
LFISTQITCFTTMSSPKTVLVTGISGFVATHVALRFLENGWNVRGTVRSDDKAKKVADLPCFKPFSKQLSFTIVKDLVSGDFTEAVKGCDAVAHTAR